jgi:hypothetical protein
MAERPERVITPTEIDLMGTQERADAIDAATARSWDDVPESFRAKVLATASKLGHQRRQRV